MSFSSASSIPSLTLRETLIRRRRRRGGGHGWARRRSLKQSSRRKEIKGVAEKLEALKQLIPSMGSCGGGCGGGAVEKGAGGAERLLEETAEYIVRLRSQVQILKHLVDLYGVGEGDRS